MFCILHRLLQGVGLLITREISIAPKMFDKAFIVSSNGLLHLSRQNSIALLAYLREILYICK